MSNELAAYIAEYVLEEIRRYDKRAGEVLDGELIMKAVDAYEGGAR